MCDYEMTSANFQYKQSVDYTYFKGSTCTYIDHVFISDQMQDNTVGCVILPYDVENTSDRSLTYENHNYITDRATEKH